jgi:hypothetical protein
MFQLCNFWHLNIGAKFAQKMLMKLNVMRLNEKKCKEKVKNTAILTASN